jgi:hypothetical protein
MQAPNQSIVQLWWQWSCKCMLDIRCSFLLFGNVWARTTPMMTRAGHRSLTKCSIILFLGCTPKRHLKKLTWDIMYKRCRIFFDEEAKYSPELWNNGQILTKIQLNQDNFIFFLSLCKGLLVTLFYIHSSLSIC